MAMVDVDTVLPIDGCAAQRSMAVLHSSYDMNRVNSGRADIATKSTENRFSTTPLSFDVPVQRTPRISA